MLDGTPDVAHARRGGADPAARDHLLPDGARGRAPRAQRQRRDGARADVLDAHHPAAAYYPDSGKVGIFTGNREEDVMVRKSSSVDYYDGETG